MSNKTATTTAEKQHDELLQILEPCIKQMNDIKVDYLILFGKDGICGRFANAVNRELVSIIAASMNANDTLKHLIEEALKLANSK